MLDRRDFLGSLASLPLAEAAGSQAAVGETINSVSDRARAFHQAHPVCDMLALNLTHPRFTIDNIDLGKRNEDTCEGDFPKFNDWGISVVMCKGGPIEIPD